MNNDTILESVSEHKLHHPEFVRYDLKIRTVVTFVITNL